jgi:hypothetical protein
VGERLDAFLKHVCNHLGLLLFLQVEFLHQTLAFTLKNGDSVVGFQDDQQSQIFVDLDLLQVPHLQTRFQLGCDCLELLVLQALDLDASVPAVAGVFGAVLVALLEGNGEVVESVYGEQQDRGLGQFLGDVFVSVEAYEVDAVVAVLFEVDRHEGVLRVADSQMGEDLGKCGGLHVLPLLLAPQVDVFLGVIFRLRDALQQDARGSWGYCLATSRQVLRGLMAVQETSNSRCSLNSEKKYSIFAEEFSSLLSSGLVFLQSMSEPEGTITSISRSVNTAGVFIFVFSLKESHGNIFMSEVSMIHCLLGFGG